MTSRSRRITADKREIKDFPKLPSATSFIRKRYPKTQLTPGGKSAGELLKTPLT